jgi:hypothetical protein
MEPDDEFRFLLARLAAELRRGASARLRVAAMALICCPRTPKSFLQRALASMQREARRMLNDPEIDQASRQAMHEFLFPTASETAWCEAIYESLYLMLPDPAVYGDQDGVLEHRVQLFREQCTMLESALAAGSNKSRQPIIDLFSRSAKMIDFDTAGAGLAARKKTERDVKAAVARGGRVSKAAARCRKIESSAIFAQTLAKLPQARARELFREIKKRDPERFADSSERTAIRDLQTLLKARRGHGTGPAH